MISISLLHPSLPKTLGELRRLTAALPDDLPLMAETASGTWDKVPALWLCDDDGAVSLAFSNPY
jgi:hypothetical protein